MLIMIRSRNISLTTLVWLPSLDRKWFILQGQLNQGKLEYKFLTTIDSVLEAVLEAVKSSLSGREFASPHPIGG